jgi:hypothetical protein
MDWKTLLAHPAADQFPLMCGMDLENLAGNILAKGQVFPIILTNEETPRILDGRNRLAAYRLLEAQGVVRTPWIETYRGELSPEDYVQSVNWERMHLNPAQKAALGALMIEDQIIGGQLKEEAKANQQAALKKGDSPSAAISANGKVADIVAKKLNISGDQVERAVRLKHENPEGFQKLKEGTSTVNAEYTKLPKKGKKAEVKQEGDAKLLDEPSLLDEEGQLGAEPESNEVLESLLSKEELEGMDKEDLRTMWQAQKAALNLIRACRRVNEHYDLSKADLVALEVWNKTFQSTKMVLDDLHERVLQVFGAPDRADLAAVAVPDGIQEEATAAN